MKKQLMTVMLALVALSAAQAKIGQTPQEVIQDSRREKAVSVQWIEIFDRPMLRVQYHDDVILHLFGSNGREIAFYYYATKGLKPEDVDKLQRRYPTTWRGTGTDGGVFTWESANGLWMAAERHEGYDCLAIFDASRIQEIPEIRNAVPASALASAPVATPAPVAAQTAPAVALVPQAHLDFVPDKPSKDENDCVLVATEALARLKTTASWARMAGFIWTENTKEIGGHAVVFFQPTQNTNVFMYDKSGSYELPTKSHDLREITDALNQALRTANIGVKTPRWMDSDGSIKEFADAAGKSDRQPIWSATAPTSTEQSAEQIAIIVGVILMLVGRIFVVVICFLKGKSGFAGLGIAWPIFAIIGAIRIGKPHSWWARKKYGPEKMDIAHRRFTPVYNEVQKATPVIIDDPVERALERVRRSQLITT